MAVYACDVIGMGTEDDPFRPAVDDHMKGWSAIDGRVDPTQAAGSMLVFCDPTPEQAAAMAADSRIEVIA